MILFAQALSVLGRNIYYSKNFKQIGSAIINEIFLRVLAVIKDTVYVIISSMIFQLLKNDTNVECNSNLSVCMERSYNFTFSIPHIPILTTVNFSNFYCIMLCSLAIILKMYLEFIWHCCSDGCQYFCKQKHL